MFVCSDLCVMWPALIATDNSAPLDAEQFRTYTSGALVSTGILEIDPRVALYIHVKVLVMMLTLARRLDEMDVCRTLVERALDIELHHEVVVSLRICPLSRCDWPSSPPVIVRLLSVRRDLLPISKKFQAPLVLPDAVESPVEVSDLALGRKDLCEQEVPNDTREAYSDQDEAKVECLLGSPCRLLGP